MTKLIPTYGYNSKGEAKLFQLEEGHKLPSGWNDTPPATKDGDFKHGSVTPPDSTSLREIPAPEANPNEIVADPENANQAPGLYTPTTWPHLPGSTDIHPDDENHDGIDGRRDPATTFNKPVTPRETDNVNTDPAPEVGADGRLVINPDEAARIKAERLNADQPVPPLADASGKVNAETKPAGKTDSKPAKKS